MGFKVGEVLKIEEIVPQKSGILVVRGYVKHKGKISFSGFITIATKDDSLKAIIKPQSYVKIKNCDVTTKYSNGRNYTNFNLYDFESLTDEEVNVSISDFEDPNADLKPPVFE